LTTTGLHPADRGRLEAVKHAPVVLEEDVWVGANAMILKGVTVGRASIVGAGAVVTKDVPPNSIVAGNPARIIGEVPKEPFKAGE
jgi:acetyltransferase-like isoleucine patch superfamily enzyme